MLLQIAMFEWQAQSSSFIYFPSDLPNNIDAWFTDFQHAGLGNSPIILAFGGGGRLISRVSSRSSSATEQVSSKPGCMRPYLKIFKYRAGQMAQLLRMGIVLPEVKCAVPNTQGVLAYNSSPRGSNTFCGLHGTCSHKHIFIHRHTQIFTKWTLWKPKVLLALSLWCHIYMTRGSTFFHKILRWSRSDMPANKK